jgi:NAD-dependent deacetylase
MPGQQMRLAERATLSADLFLVIGSSLVVWPAAGFPVMAKRNGARFVIINRESTDQDRFADLVVHDDIGDTLEPFIG